MRKIASLTAVIVVGAFLAGCTVRYSQVVTGSIRKVNTNKLINSDNGTDVGIGFGGGTDFYKTAHGIAFREPKGAAELMNYPCDAEFVEVDYRSKWYAYYIRVDSPEIAVTTYCIEQE